MRTTLDIDDPVLRELKRLQVKEGKSLGRLASDLLARALKEDATQDAAAPPSQWIAKPMGARVNLSDKDAVYHAPER
ncbi:MAG: antitoxin [Gemmatimonadetes bacterium]|nr:antitoxin [Gemmatimonadota bacterium]